ncbi:uncharacterized protein LOC120622856 [Pteropus medius]|uniref:uncharacterized protein LOC120622856 n=1 Tax=Pteropus vampyrus TaxID=132908 RepID=UPI00196AA514|nr:uncharacterized protein LOC120622856 [Pteropus giganteus]
MCPFAPPRRSKLGFSDQKPGLALPPASKHMPLKAASFSPGPGTSLPHICYSLWPCLGHDVEDPQKETLLPSAWLHVGGEGWFGDQLGRIHGCQWDLIGQDPRPLPRPQAGTVLNLKSTFQGAVLGTAAGGRKGPTSESSGSRKVGPHSQQTLLLVALLAWALRECSPSFLSPRRAPATGATMEEHAPGSHEPGVWPPPLSLRLHSTCACVMPCGSLSLSAHRETSLDLENPQDEPPKSSLQAAGVQGPSKPVLLDVKCDTHKKFPLLCYVLFWSRSQSQQ